MNRIGLVGLIRIDLPGQTIRLTDGGFIVWGVATYASKDALFGTIGTLEGLSEGADEEVPALSLTMLPPDSSSPGELSQPGFQQSRVRLWLGEYDAETGVLVGSPDILFDGQIDQTTFTEGRDVRELAMSIVSSAERLFERNIGNSLSPTFHKSVWPGETGNDNATGLNRQVAWGVASAQAGAGKGIRDLIAGSSKGLFG